MAALDPSKYTPDRSLAAKLKRRLTQWRAARPMPANPHQPIVTFSFDDFPKSAADYGADALAAIGATGTYYASTGMAGTRNLTGDLFTTSDLTMLAQAGHEIGAHTENHLDCAQASPARVRREIAVNQIKLAAMVPTHPAQNFAWPYGETQFRAKADIADLVTTARGILPGINRKGTDLMQLRAFELSPEDWTTARAAKAIETAAHTPGWVIIFTHDVRPNPSPFGTTPDALARLTRLAHDSGAQVLTMAGALAQIQTEHGA